MEISLIDKKQSYFTLNFRLWFFPFARIVNIYIPGERNRSGIL